jgi:hypothetical protein
MHVSVPSRSPMNERLKLGDRLAPKSMSRILFLGLQRNPTGFYTIDIIGEVEFLTNPVNK